jgi:hypothetical protein
MMIKLSQRRCDKVEIEPRYFLTLDSMRAKSQIDQLSYNLP